MSYEFPKSFAASGIDEEAFSQILDMDDEEEDPDTPRFSETICTDFFVQAQECISKIQDALAKGDLPKLAEHGHFLKGSSATIGLSEVRDSCETIQNYGKGQPDETSKLSKEERLQVIRTTVPDLVKQLNTVEVEIKKYYENLKGSK